MSFNYLQTDDRDDYLFSLCNTKQTIKPPCGCTNPRPSLKPNGKLRHPFCTVCSGHMVDQQKERAGLYKDNKGKWRGHESPFKKVNNG